MHVQIEKLVQKMRNLDFKYSVVAPAPEDSIRLFSLAELIK